MSTDGVRHTPPGAQKRNHKADIETSLKRAAKNAKLLLFAICIPGRKAQKKLLRKNVDKATHLHIFGC